MAKGLNGSAKNNKGLFSACTGLAGLNAETIIYVKPLRVNSVQLPNPACFYIAKIGLA